MPKFSRKFYRRGPRDKYSIETKSFSTTSAANPVQGLYQSTVNVVPPMASEGMRKVKHLTASITPSVTGTGVTVYWALVYVPEGYAVNPLNAAGSFYEPSQFVMASGIADPDAGPIRVRSPLSRNLNSGDSIWMVLGTSGAGVVSNGLVSYAISLQ